MFKVKIQTKTQKMKRSFNNNTSLNLLKCKVIC